jgi:hypothetical protein
MQCVYFTGRVLYQQVIIAISSKLRLTFEIFFETVFYLCNTVNYKCVLTMDAWGIAR